MIRNKDIRNGKALAESSTNMSDDAALFTMLSGGSNSIINCAFEIG